MAKLWQLDYGYKVKTPEGEKGYVTGITEKGKIEISLREKPYSGVHDIIEPVSNLEVLVIGNPHNICDIEYELVPDKQTEFFLAKLDLLLLDPQTILDNKRYFTVLPNDDWIELAEKAVKEYDNDFLKSLRKKLYKAKKK